MYWEVSNILQWKEEGSGKLCPAVNRVFVYLIFVGIKLPIDCTKHKCIRSFKDLESLNNPLL